MAENEYLPYPSHSINEMNAPKASKPLKDERRSYPCKYCRQKFSTPHALGGHQNAHRAERALAKVEVEKKMAALEYLSSGLHPYSSMPPTPPLDGVFNSTSQLPYQPMVLGHRYGQPMLPTSPHPLYPQLPMPMTHEPPVTQPYVAVGPGMFGDFSSNAGGEYGPNRAGHDAANRMVGDPEYQLHDATGLDLSLKL